MIIPTAKKVPDIHTPTYVQTPGSVTHSRRAKRANKIKRRDGPRSGTVLLGQMVERRKGLDTHGTETHTRASIFIGGNAETRPAKRTHLKRSRFSVD
jgi:hypothetical protein